MEQQNLKCIFKKSDLVPSCSNNCAKNNLNKKIIANLLEKPGIFKIMQQMWFELKKNKQKETKPIGQENTNHKLIILTLPDQLWPNTVTKMKIST